MKKLLIIILMIVGYSKSHAHSPTEVSFKLIEEKGSHYLKVHLTTTTLFAIIEELHPELRKKESLNLSHFIADYEAYFNRHINVNLNGRDLDLSYVKSNLIVHDASISFLIEGFQDHIESYHLSITGFDFYSNPTYAFLLRTDKLASTCFMNRRENSCSGTQSLNTTSIVANQSVSLFLLMVGAGVIFTGFWIYRKSVLIA